jgi:hypothetical protein
MGFEAKGDVMTLAMPVADEKRYEAETRLVKLLNRYYLRPSAQNIRVELPPTAIQLPLRPWNFQLLAASLLVACLGVTPYIHFSILRHTSFLTLAIFFPFCRVLGGLLCVFPGQLLLQYRIRRILEQRLLFIGINNLLNAQTLKIPTQSIRWDETYASEACLSSLNDFLHTPAAQSENAKPFIKVIAQALRLQSPPTTERSPTVREVASKLDSYLRNTWAWLVMLISLLLGFGMTLVGYVGCFTIVQSTSAPSDTYIWLGAEAALALIRLSVWAWNPLWDESDGVCLMLDCSNPPILSATSEKPDDPAETFQIVGDQKFWETLIAYSGPVDLDGMKRVRGFRHWYSWTRRGNGSEILCIVLQEDRIDGWTILCTMNSSQDLEFHHAKIITDWNAVTAVRKVSLEDDHALMKAPSEFKMDVWEHYGSIMWTKNRSSARIQISWTLSQYS